MNPTILKLSPSDWQKYRAIRLMALQSDPLAFGSSYEEEINLSEADWRNRINAMWFAMINNDMVGLIGLLQRESLASKHCGYIISLWVRPEFRKHGVARSLVENLQKISSSLGIKKLSLQVTATQDSAKRLYENLGFTNVGLLKQNLLKDGVYLDEYLMEWLINSNH